MKCPKCGFEHNSQNVECMKCGIIFSKFQKSENRKTRPQASTERQSIEENEPAVSIWKQIWNMLLYVKPETNPLIFGGRALVFLVLLIWGLKFIFTPLETNYTGESFWHLINLPFHEAGHIIFRPFGRFITSLGGSLAQVLMPLVCFTVFVIKTRDVFAASFSLWWTGESFMDLAPYINDARSLTLPLLGGNTGRTSPYGFHDWEFILKESGLIRHEHFIAGLSYKFGTLLMIIALVVSVSAVFRKNTVARENSNAAPAPEK